jgi:DNA-binding transcriptional LysR family regulator
MTLPSMSDILYFVEVATTKNISRAAERIGITQPSLSQAMQRLETSLDCSLLIRERIGIRLTEAGKEFLGSSKALLSQWEQSCYDVKRTENEVIGKFKLGIHTSVALYSLSKFMPALLTENSELSINLVHDLSRNIAERVASCEVDYGIVVNPVNNPEFVISKIATDEITLWAHKSIVNKNDFDPFKETLICDPDLLQVQSLLKNNTKSKQVFSRIIHSSNLEVVTDLVSSKMGVGILPARVATKNKKSDLVPLNDIFGTFKDRICLIYRSDTPKTAAHKAIVGAIKGSLKD